MSSARGSGAPRVRGRGSAPPGPRGRGRGASTSRGRVFNATPSQRGNFAPKGTAGFGQGPGRGSGGTGRGQNSTRGNPFASAVAKKNAFGSVKTKGNWNERYELLKEAYKEERKDAIAKGLIADPDKPRALSDAITPAGVCQDMCDEFERVTRVYQDDVWAEELGTDGQPDEARMVKKFRRSAAGIEEQLPSELRPPHILKRTCDYLFDEVIGNASSLAQVHHFVWDRTRAIRNDFSIQQLTKQEELRIAVDCYERIARFHILSLHQLASPERPYAKYDWPQEREQLDRTLLSLIQYYEDTRGRIEFPNEAEFRAYCVIFQLRSPTPDLEDNAQTWPKAILRDKRVRKALEVYAAGCTVMRPQGPLNPKASHLIAQQNWQRIWTLLASNEVSYLMGCTAEVYFNSIRQTVLNALFKTFRANTTLPTPDWTTDVLCDLFAFDDEEELQTYCRYFGFAFKVREDGQQYLDLSSVPGRTFPQPNADMPNQLKSSLVENKRFGRTLPAVINGMNVRQAQDVGLVVEEEDDAMEEVEGGEEETMNSDGGQESAAEEDEGSLFIPEGGKPKETQLDAASALTNGLNSQPKASPFTWGAPSEAAKSPFSTTTTSAQPSNEASKPKFNFLSGTASSETSEGPKRPCFDFLGGAAKPVAEASSSTNGFKFPGATPNTVESSSVSKPAFNFLGGASAPAASSGTATLKFDFVGGTGLGGYNKAPQKTANAESGSIGESSPAKGPSESAPQQNGLFSKPSQERSIGGPTGPFQLAAPASPDFSSPERSMRTDQDNTQPKPALPTAKSPRAATVEDAPPSSDSSQNASSHLPSNDPGPTPSTAEPPPSPASQARQAPPQQPHFTAPSAPQPPTFSNTSPSPPQLNTGLRRPSTSTDNKPKKPSPLSHSFTAADESSASARAPLSGTSAKAPETTVAKQAPHQPQASNPQAQASTAPEPPHLTKPVPFKRKPQDQSEVVESLDETAARIARELVNDPISGYLKQYVEYKASQVITAVQEEISAEKMNLRLSELRISTIYRKYFKRWISLIWQRRLAKSGKDRRQRRRKRLEDGFDDGSSYAGGSVRDSRPGSVVGSIGWKDHHENVDAMFQRTMNSRSLAQTEQARAGSKRPSSAHGENGVVPRASAHKRMKSTSHVDDRGRVTKPTSTSSPNDDLMKRSSFLGFSINGSSPPNRNTTKSNYFRLKAMGVHRADQLSAPRGTKRSRPESVQPVQTSPPALRNSVSGGSSPEDSTNKSLMPPPASTVSRAQKAKEEDDALFARIRAARESLTIGSAYMRQEVEQDESFRRSLSASQSSNESPSMLKARADARARASRSGSQERDVPAYRLRESRFVPREHYGRAIERAKEMRESRSRETSRPGSRFEHLPETTLAPTPKPFSFSAATDSRTQHDIPNGFSAPQSPKKDQAIKPPASFSPDEQHTPLSFANHNTEMSNANPFLQSTEPKATEPLKSTIKSPFASAEKSSGFEFTPLQTSGNTFGSGSVLGFGGPSAFGSQSSFAPQPPASGFGQASAFKSQGSFASQPPASGFQSVFGSQPDLYSQPTFPQKPSFGSPFGATSQSTFANDAMQSAFASPQDQTIEPEMIDQSLENSFGSHNDNSLDHFKPANAFEPVPPQEDSYLHGQTIDLISDDDEDKDDQDSAAVQVDHFQTNGLATEHIEHGYGEDEEELLDEEETEDEGFQPPYGHANPFSLLADQTLRFDELHSESQAEGDEMYDQDQFEAEDGQQIENGFQSQDEDGFSNDDGAHFDNGYISGEGDEDDEGIDADVDEESDVDAEDEDEDEGAEDGEDFDSEEDDEEDEGEGDAGFAPPSRPKPQLAAPRHPPPSALRGMGTTEDAPIELDSD